MICRDMKLPGAELAIVDLAKLRDYCLNPSHPRGRHKARVFLSALGLTSSDADTLRSYLLDAAVRFDASPSEADQYGHRFIIDFECWHWNKQAKLRSVWIIRRGEAFPILTTCFVLLD